MAMDDDESTERRSLVKVLLLSIGGLLALGVIPLVAIQVSRAMRPSIEQRIVGLWRADDPQTSAAVWGPVLLEIRNHRIGMTGPNGFGSSLVYEVVERNGDCVRVAIPDAGYGLRMCQVEGNRLDVYPGMGTLRYTRAD